MLKKKKTLIIIVIVFIVLAGISAVALKGKSDKSDNKIKTTQLKKQYISSSIQTTGVIESMDKRNIISDVEEKMEKMYVKKGDIVSKGQILMELEKTRINYDIKEAYISLDIAQKELEELKSTLKNQVQKCKLAFEEAKINEKRNKILYENRSISKKNYDNTKDQLIIGTNDFNLIKEKYGDGENGRDILKKKHEIELLNIKIGKLKDKYNKHTIKAPINGTIVDTNISESGIVESYKTLMLIQDVENLEINLFLNEYDASKIVMDQDVEIKGDAFEDKVYKGKIKYIGPFAKKVSTGQGEENVVEVKVHIVNVDKYLKPGFSAKLNILINEKKDALVVPYEAIFTKKDKTEVVYSVVDEKIKENKIHMGIEGDLEVEIIGTGLKEGDKIILNPTEKLEDGQDANLDGDK